MPDERDIGVRGGGGVKCVAILPILNTAMPNSEFPISPNSARPIDFHHMEASPFEELSCALYRLEPGIKSANLFRINGQAQYGVDIQAYRSSDDQIEVVSCKCRKDIKKGDIRAWSDEFFKHVDGFWKGEGVVKFVLVVAQLVNSKDLDDEIVTERERFAKVGIGYVVWEPRELQHKLRPQYGITKQYLTEEIANRICDVGPLKKENDLLKHQLKQAYNATHEIGEELSNTIQRHLDSIYENICKGLYDGVDQALYDLRNSNYWLAFTCDIKARIIRLQGSMALTHDDIEAAQRFSDEADQISSADEPRLRALIAFRKGNKKEALEILDGVNSRNGIQLLISIILDPGSVTDALELLEKHKELLASHPETVRLTALAKLIDGKRKEALVRVKAAEKNYPDWMPIKRAGAIIRYACSFSPIVSPAQILNLNPSPIEFVRQDDETVTLLTEAAETFAALESADFTSKYHRYDEIWRLACLFNLSERFEEASTLCLSVLERDPTNTATLGLAFSRGVEFDQDLSSKELLLLLESGQGKAAHLSTLIQLTHDPEQPERSLDLVKKYEYLFDSEELRPTIEAWIKEWSDQINGIEPGDVFNKLTALFRKAMRDNIWEDVEKEFAQLGQNDTLMTYFLHFAQELAKHDRWQILGQFTDVLASYETVSAVRLAIFSAFNTKQFQRAVNLIEVHRSAFPSNNYPSDLKQMEAAAHFELHNISRAYLILDQLAASDDQDERMRARMMKANMYVKTGNILEALPTIQTAKESDSLEVEQALFYAQHIALEDIELAQELWLYAKEKGISKDHALPAAFLAFNLGLDHETASLFSLADSSHVKAVSIDEFLEMARSHHEHKSNIEVMYFSGTVPVHVALDSLNGNLSAMYKLTEVSGSGDGQRPLFIRHGARPANLTINGDPADWKIMLDITSLHIAFQLGILEVLEELQFPIMVPSSLPNALIELERKSLHGQPRLVEVERLIQEAIQNKRADVIKLKAITGEIMDGLEARLEEARSLMESEGGLVVDHHLPEGEDDYKSDFATPKAIVDSLREMGELTIDEYDEAIRRLGSYALEQCENRPQPGMLLFFFTNTISILADAGLLEALLSRFEVKIDSDYLAQSSEEIRGAEYGSELASLIRSMRKRVAQGIVNGKFQFIGGGTSEEAASGGAIDDMSFSTKCLFELIRAPEYANGILYIDDRNLSGYEHSGTNKIMGTLEILNGLHESGLLSDSRYYEYLIKLRASNAMFLPIETDELMFHIRQAPLADGMITETTSLAVIRRYLSRALGFEENLKIDESNKALAGRPIEAKYLLDLRNVAQKAVVELWNDNTLNSSQRWAYASWIWPALRVERIARFEAFNPEGSIPHPAICLSGIITSAMQITGGDHVEKNENLEDFFRWLDQNILTEHIERDSDLFDESIRFIANGLVNLLDKDRSENRPDKLSDEQATALSQLYVRQYVAALPEKIRNSLHKNETLNSKMGVSFEDRIQIGDVTFAASTFWNSVQEALRSGTSDLESTEHQRVKIRVDPNRECGVTFSGAATGELSRPIMAVLEAHRDTRQNILESNPEWYDLPPEKQFAAIKEIVSEENAASVVRLVDEYQGRSPAFSYQEMQRILQSGETLPHDKLIPGPVGRLKDHLRLPSDLETEMQVQLEHGAKTLIDQLGVLETFKRFSALPTEMPSAIIEELKTRNLDELAEELSHVEDAAVTPVRMLQALRLFYLVPHLDPEEKRQALLLDRLIKTWPSSGSLFNAFLYYSEAHFSHDPEWRSLTNEEKFIYVWLHADYLTGMLVGAGINVTEAINTVKETIPQTSFQHSLSSGSVYEWFFSPRWFPKERLLYHGIGYLLGEEDAGKLFSDEEQVLLRNLMSIQIQEKEIVSPLIFRGFGSSTISMKTVLKHCPIELIKDAPLSQEATQNEAETIIGLIEGEPSILSSWNNAASFILYGLSDEQSRRLKGVIRKCKITLDHGNKTDLEHITRNIAPCMMLFGDENAYQKVQDMAVAMAKAMSDKYKAQVGRVTSSSPSEAQLVVLQIGELLRLSSQDTDVQVAIERFAEAVERVLLVWPKAAPIFRDIIDNMLKTYEIKSTKRLWKSYLLTRSLQ